MAELKAGGLALVFGLKEQVESNGKCVRLLSVIHSQELYKSPVTGDRWRHASGNSSWICIGDVHTSCKRESGWGTFNPRNLLPIDGDDFQHEDERQKELTHG